MAFMNKMRDSMPVVFAALAGVFLLTIIFDWGAQGSFFKKGYDGQTLGTVNGRKINTKDYEDARKQLLENKKNELKKTDLTDQEETQVEEQAWDQLVTQAIIRN